MKSDLIDMKLHLHHKTDSALLASETGDNDKAIWLPLSQVEWDGSAPGGTVDVTLPEWLALEKGLI